TALSATGARRLDLDALWPRYGYPNDLLAQVQRAGLRLAQATVRPVYESEDSGVRVRDAFITVPYVLLRALLRRGFAFRSSNRRQAASTSSLDSASSLVPRSHEMGR
ncbi:MAG: hypothetical protein AAGF12_26820, partial [Myxococcota bacterium]